MAKTRNALGRGLNALIPSGNYNSNGTATAPADFLDNQSENAVDDVLEVAVTPPSETSNGHVTTSNIPVSENIGFSNETRKNEPRKVGLSWVEITSIAPNPYQPRKHIDPEVLNELADSIRELGIIQPPVVSYNPDFDEKALADLDGELVNTELLDTDGKNRRARYLLIAGERRWQASKLAGLTTIPVVIKESTPLQMLEMALVENIQRADLSPLEEAAAYRQLVTEFKMTQEDVARRVGKSRAAVANVLRLLDMRPALYQQLSDGNITEGHARALLMVRNERYQLRLLNEVLNENMSVRQTEERARRYNAMLSTKEALDQLEEATKSSRANWVSERETRYLEEKLESALGTKVELIRSKKGGKITIQFFSDDELDGVYRRIMGDNEI